MTLIQHDYLIFVLGNCAIKLCMEINNLISFFKKLDTVGDCTPSAFLADQEGPKTKFLEKGPVWGGASKAAVITFCAARC